MPKVDVNCDVLRWARETAGLSLIDAASKLQIRPQRNLSPDQLLGALESGAQKPTRSQLLRMSKHYRRPLVAFYLESPPRKGDRGQDFRRLPANYHEADEALVDALVRDVKARQSLLRAALEDEDEDQPLPFIASSRTEDGVDKLCASIRQNINFDLHTFRVQRTATDAFAYLRDQVEKVGIFVLLIGDLGSHHTRLTVDAFRGFALADPVAPFVILNDQDARAAWSFTLLHELSHLWLGQTGISGAVAETSIERFCNDVASALLLPAHELALLDVSAATPFDVAVERINEFSDARNISRSMVAYKLFALGAISHQDWTALREEFRRQWLEYRVRERERARNEEGGPNYYIVRRHRTGKALVELVSRMMSSGTLTPTKAGKVLGIKPKNVYGLIHHIP